MSSFVTADGDVIQAEAIAGVPCDTKKPLMNRLNRKMCHLTIFATCFQSIAVAFFRYFTAALFPFRDH
jgi:hypothetical protein